MASPRRMVWEAVRTGPGNMPRFGPGTLSPRAGRRRRRLCREGHRAPRTSPGGIYLGGVGPVAEGFIGLFVGVGACLLAAFWVGDRTEKDEDDGHDGGDGTPATILTATTTRGGRRRRAEPAHA